MEEKHSRYLLDINGIVQGVGFRPFVYNLARACRVCGWVNNFPGGVHIDAEGSDASVKEFIEKLRSEAPPLSLIDTFRCEEAEPAGYTDFEIRKSSLENANEAFISPDVSVCKDCIREMNDPDDRRYGYPFINCTNCGPRFTITSSIPYDRVNTTMRVFPMCEDCAREYGDPSDRRFHAQPVACGRCGPSLFLLRPDGSRISEGEEIEKTASLLNEGGIMAVKGLGGYHLACDAENREAVRRLRKRKHRDGKPFALMAKDIETASKYCFIGAKEAELLQSVRKPIVLLERKPESGSLPLDYISPDNDRLGIMLPYTPVHYLLFKNGPKLLIMTSGNRSGEPIYYKDGDALRGLRGIADCFLTNNREIYIRTDDSVTEVFRGKEYIIRRSRGYVPLPLDISAALNGIGPVAGKPPSVLACGGELKNTFCVTKGYRAFPSHHIGDLENIETLTSFESGIEHFEKIFSVEPKLVAFDMHPDYLSTQYAERLPGAVKIPVQHHRAHIASCMAENGVTGPVIGVAFDGTGYGDDGCVWGGEFFTGDYSGFERRAHFEYVPLPGGETAIKEPWRMALSCLSAAYGSGSAPDGLPFLNEIDEEKAGMVKQQIARGINAPPTSSAGRLFDAVSALIGLCNTIEYEGQAAIRLEKAADVAGSSIYDYEIDSEDNNTYNISVKKTIFGIAGDVMKGAEASYIAGAFHRTMARIILDVCERLRKETDMDRVALSGGVFQNRLLLGLTAEALEKNGFHVYIHSKVPTNDGGISLGQAVLALRKYMEGNYE